MRHVVILLVAVTLIAGCSGGRTVIRSTRSTVTLDFTPFTKQGFLFTPEPYRGEYESIGVVTVTMTASGKQERIRSGIYDWTWDESNLQSDSLLTYLYEQAAGMGANAVVNLSLTSSFYRLGELYIPQMEARGFAIRRVSR